MSIDHSWLLIRALILLSSLGLLVVVAAGVAWRWKRPASGASARAATRLVHHQHARGAASVG